MAKYFLGSVGSAEAFRLVDGQPKMAFVAKTLTDSSISVTITKDELRGGTNAPVVTNFFHDPAVAITLTDILYKESYIEAQLGTSFSRGQNAYQGETVPYKDNKLTLKQAPADIPMLKCDSGAVTKMVWYALEGSDDYKVSTAINGKDVTIEDGVENKNYCVRYYGSSQEAKEAVVKSNLIPQELMLIITVPIFAGDACAASKGSKAGTLTFEVPRFQLDGGQEFTFNMSSNATMSLNGTAMVIDDGCDAGSGKLFRIIEVIEGRSLTEGLMAIAINPESAAVGNKVSDVEIYALYDDKSLMLLKHDTEDLTINIGDAATTEETVLKANDALTVTFGGKKDSYTVVAA